MNIKSGRQSEKRMREMIRRNRLYGLPSEFVNKVIDSFNQQESRYGFKLDFLVCERVSWLLKHLRFHNSIINSILLERLRDLNFDYLLALFGDGEFVFSREVSEGVFVFSL